MEVGAVVVLVEGAGTRLTMRTISTLSGVVVGGGAVGVVGVETGELLLGVGGVGEVGDSRGSTVASSRLE